MMEKKTNEAKSIWKEKTFWGCMCLFIAGGLQAIELGEWATIIQQIATVVGLPLTVYGVADRLK